MDPANNKFPKFNLTAMSRRRAKLREALIGGSFSYKRVQATIYPDLTHCILKALRISHTPNIAEAIVTVLSRFAGKDLDRTNLFDLVDLIIGFLPGIEKGIALQPWIPNKRPLWSCFRVENIEPVLSKKPGRYTCTVKAYADKATLGVWNIVISKQYAKFLIRNCGGRRDNRYYPEDLFGLWFTATIHKVTDRIEITNVCVSSSQRKANRELLDKRQGMCPGLAIKGKCFSCWVGADFCALARHPLSFSKGRCKCTHPKEHMGYIQKDGFCMLCIRNYSYLRMLGTSTNVR